MSNWQEQLMELDTVIKSVSLTRDQHTRLQQNILSIQHYINSLEAIKTIDNDKSTAKRKTQKDPSLNGYS